MRNTFVVSKGTFGADRPLTIRTGDKDRVTKGGHKPKVALFVKWTGSVVSKASQPTPPWLKEYRSATLQPKNAWKR